MTETTTRVDGNETSARDDGNKTSARDDGNKTSARDDGNETSARDDGNKTSARVDANDIITLALRGKRMMQHKTRTDGRRHEAVHGSTVDITTTAIPLVVSSLNLSPAPGRQSTDGTAEFSEAQDSGMRNIPWKSVAVDYPSGE